GQGLVPPQALTRPAELEAIMTTTFTPEHAAALGGPDWLRDRRVAAATEAADLALPSVEEEVWRYSRIDELDLDDFAPVAAGDAAPGAVPPAARAVLDAFTSRAGALVVHDGHLVHAELDSDVAGRGVTLGRIADLDRGA